MGSLLLREDLLIFKLCTVEESASHHVDCVSGKFLNPLRCFDLFCFFLSDGALVVHVVVVLRLPTVSGQCLSNCSSHSVLLYRWVIGVHVVSGWSCFNDCVRISMVCHSPRGCWLCSTSLPGGHQVDGLHAATVGGRALGWNGRSGCAACVARQGAGRRSATFGPG